MSNTLEGFVASISKDGSLISDISNEKVQAVPNHENTIVRFGGHETCGLFPADHGQPAATMVASKGKSGFLEIEIVGISLAEMLGVEPGEKITVNW